MRYLSTFEAAERLGLKRGMVNHLILTGVIEVYERVTNYKGDRTVTYRIPEAEVERVRRLRLERGLLR